MKLDFKVHNASTVPLKRQVQHQGVSVNASIECLEIELDSVAFYIRAPRPNQMTFSDLPTRQIQVGTKKV